MPKVNLNILVIGSLTSESWLHSLANRLDPSAMTIYYAATLGSPEAVQSHHYDVILVREAESGPALQRWPDVLCCEPVIDDEKMVCLKPLRTGQDGLVGLVADYLNRHWAEENRYRDELIQTVSHELRTPLTYIVGYVDLLLSGQPGALNSEQISSLQIVANKTRALDRLVSDLMSSGQPNAEDLLLEVLNLGELAEQAVQGIRASAAEQGITLLTDIDHHAGLVLADSGRMGQVFDNLLGNALKFSPSHGMIMVRVFRRIQHVRVEIEDTGDGISPDDQGHIFERFYQARASCRRPQSGLGLGLAICKRIIEAHGGQIGVTSQEGVGSTFYFELPEAGFDSPVS